MIGPEQVKQRETRAETSVSDTMTANGHVQQVGEPVEQTIAVGDGSPGESLNQHAEAGRKGAQRIHQLIQEGRLYEREHGLKAGRQRLRQLIQEGKLYEQEHGLKADSKRARIGRRPRISQEQIFKTLFQSLLRLAKPAYRSRILALAKALEDDSN
jgi:hypothetical protein